MITEIQEAELNVQRARDDFCFNQNYLVGALGCLYNQGIINEKTLNMLEEHLIKTETHSKRIETEFYRLRNILKEYKIS